MKFKVKPENREAFENSVRKAAAIAQGFLGWSGQARIMVEMGVDRECGIRGKKRIRVKRMKKYIKQVFLQDIARYVER